MRTLDYGTVLYLLMDPTLIDYTNTLSLPNIEVLNTQCWFYHLILMNYGSMVGTSSQTRYILHG